MPDKESLLKILNEGVIAWNTWRTENPAVTNLDLSEPTRYNPEELVVRHTNGFQLDLVTANLRDVDLSGNILLMCSCMNADFERANLTDAILGGADCRGANFNQANLTNVDLGESDCRGANFTGADLTGAKLSGCNFQGANFTGANLTGADLTASSIVGAVVEGTIFRDCVVYGLSTWDLQGAPAEQSNLIITQEGHHKVTVDDIQLAQFMHLLLDSPKVRNAIDTITSKVVLILGRFTDDRKAILDSIRDELRRLNYVPLLFDFNGPTNRNVTETVSTLAHLAKFVIADISDPRSIPQELMRIIPQLTSVPVQPLLLSSQREYGMFGDFRPYPWVLEIYNYRDINEVIGSVYENLVRPAERWLAENR